ncbi:MAG: hypothetical protein HONBIEJF_00693 [Fimbriimonadaceae bacterium]|nr:hypothetical protein [Fimbriimonadaceae bacterium]
MEDEDITVDCKSALVIPGEEPARQILVDSHLRADEELTRPFDSEHGFNFV